MLFCSRTKIYYEQQFEIQKAELQKVFSQMIKDNQYKPEVIPNTKDDKTIYDNETKIDVNKSYQVSNIKITSDI